MPQADAFTAVQALESVNMQYSAAALRMIDAQERLEQKQPGSAPFMRPSSRKALCAADVQSLEHELGHELEKTLGIIALMIGEVEGDLKAVSDMIELIDLMDQAFASTNKFALDPAAFEQHMQAVEAALVRCLTLNDLLQS
jgi:hypothetical protein